MQDVTALTAGQRERVTNQQASRRTPEPLRLTESEPVVESAERGRGAEDSRSLVPSLVSRPSSHGNSSDGQSDSLDEEEGLELCKAKEMRSAGHLVRRRLAAQLRSFSPRKQK